jgi:dTDP-4-dehydrorhamnose reductase
MKSNNKDTRIIPVSTEKYYKDKKAADRPLNSRLDKSRLEEIGLHRLPSWKDAADRYFQELRDEQLVLRRLNK